MAEEPKKSDLLELAPETQAPQEEEQKNFWGKLKRGLFMTHNEIIEKVSSAVKGETALDESTLEYLEEVLIGADMGVETSLELVDMVRKNALKEQTTSATRLRKILSDEIADLLFQGLEEPTLTRRIVSMSCPGYHFVHAAHADDFAC